jgi:hypothetical protein
MTNQQEQGIEFIGSQQALAQLHFNSIIKL